MKKATSLLTLLILTVVFTVSCFAQKEPKGLYKTGAKASAEIIKEWQTAITVNGQPVVGLELKVNPANGNPFIVTIHQRVSILQTSFYIPGSIVQVRYDSTALPINPKKKTKKVVIESLGAKAEEQTTTAYDPKLVDQYTRELITIDSANKILRANGVMSKAIILTYGSYKNLNLTVGDNPVVTMDVQVIPDGQPSFKGSVIGIIHDTSIPKYQPGKEIYVKYDPNDHTKVTVDHSE